MLELLLVALMSPEAQDFLVKVPDLHQVESVQMIDPEPVPILEDRAVEPVLLDDKKTAVLAMDIESGRVLYQENAYRAQPIASITKLMTALIVLENHDMDEVVSVSREATRTVGAGIGIYHYEKLTVETLLEAILIGSANDAAVALATHHAGSEEEFVKIMNQRAQEWGLHTAKFYNATGLDVFETKLNDEDVLEFTGKVFANEMSAYHVLQLARRAYNKSFIRVTVGKEKFVGYSTDGEFVHQKDTTNDLLGSFLNIGGLKTGYTEKARQCFVSVGYSPEGKPIMTVILGSSDRFGQTKKLLSWIYDNYTWE